jgi:hypothetical protein
MRPTNLVVSNRERHSSTSASRPTKNLESSMVNAARPG